VTASHNFYLFAFIVAIFQRQLIYSLVKGKIEQSVETSIGYRIFPNFLPKVLFTNYLGKLCEY